MARVRGARVCDRQAVGQKKLYGADNFNGESARAEQTLEDAGLRPNEEMVIVQSETLTIKDPEFRTAVDQASDRLTRAKYVVNVKSPLSGGGSVSPDGHTALIDFQITGNELEAADRIDPSAEAIDSVQAIHEET